MIRYLKKNGNNSNTKKFEIRPNHTIFKNYSWEWPLLIQCFMWELGKYVMERRKQGEQEGFSTKKKENLSVTQHAIHWPNDHKRMCSPPKASAT